MRMKSALSSSVGVKGDDDDEEEEDEEARTEVSAFLDREST